MADNPTNATYNLTTIYSIIPIKGFYSFYSFLFKNDTLH